jgi:hypothetical protein
VIIGDDDTGDAIRCHALNGDTGSAGEGLPESLKKIVGRLANRKKP